METLTDLASVLSTIATHRITEPLLVPPIIIRLVREPSVLSPERDLSCIKAFSSGAAPVSEEILQLLQRRFPAAGFRQGYGMTESCSCITIHPATLLHFKYAHTVGRVCGSTTIKIVKEDGSEGGVGEAGEIWARGPQVVMGYLGNEKATKETFVEGGWLRTGDVGVVDEEGFVTIVDRIKEMVKVKGIGVAPAEMEDLLLGNDKVEDCAVLGVPDEWAGEVPKACVVLKPAFRGHNLEEVGRELMSYVRERKVRHKWIKEVEVVDEIPKSASGKILRRVLRDKVKSWKKGILVRDDERGEEKARL